MSESCIFEFEDNVWDEFCRSDDHIVPNPGAKRAEDDPVLDDSHKKPRHEVTSTTSNSGDRFATGCFDQQREPSNLASNNTMTSCHGLKSNNTDSNSSEKCAKDTILSCKTTTVDKDSLSDPLADMDHTNNNLDFFENTEEKESNDSLYYGWPEIGNFEDVDRMFRSCESTFGLEASNENELGWLSSADNTGGCGDVLKSNFTFPCPESNAMENINESAITSAHVSYKDSSWVSENSDSYLSYVNGTAIGDSKDGLITKEQINDHKKQLKPKNQSMGKRKEHYSGNVSFGYMSNLTDEATQFPSGATSHQAYPSVPTQQAFGVDSYSHLQNPFSYVHSDSTHFANQNSVNPRPSIVKSETSEPAGSKKRERPHNHQGLNSNFKNGNTAVWASICNPASQGHFSVDKIEHRNDTKGMVMPITAELGSTNVQESSMMSLGLDDTSPEAASFHQLQLVMEQLDLRTKLCIRDSLYRLARSAEQRHNHANLNGDERDASGAFMAQGTNNFMDMETDTNPIDRSIAHLLFHRPSESSAVPNNVQGSVTSPPIIEENMVICDETAFQLEKDMNC